MIYKAKEGSKAYEYIRNILETEEKERNAYFNRVNEAVGFKVMKYGGYRQNGTINRTCEITSILVEDNQWENLDKKLWKKTGIINGFVKIVPIKRTKKGKEIAEVLRSYKSVNNHWKILDDLGLKDPGQGKFSITQFFSGNNNYFVYFDDSIRADKDNSDLEEITSSELERLIEKTGE